MTTVGSARSRRQCASVRAAAAALLLVLLVACSGGGSARTASTASDIVLGVGADESQRIVTWHSSGDTAQVVQVAATATVDGGAFPADASSFAATGGANDDGDGYHRDATVTGLEAGTTYSYRVGAEGAWSPVYSFVTGPSGPDFDFLFFGDPQIGASGDTAADTAGWADTLSVAVSSDPAPELLVGAGDETNAGSNQTQWEGFFSPDQLRQVPWVATVGNHDVGSASFDQHHTTPNTDGQPPAGTSGSDYWFVYKGVLFVVLADSQGDNNAHLAFVTDVVHAHGADARYTVLIYHHSIYSAAVHAKDRDIKTRREDYPAVFSALGVDLVLQGHDHAYTRSYVIADGHKADPAEQPGQADVVAGPGGVVYVTAGSSSGSKYYELSKPDGTATSGGGNGADPLDPSSYWYGSVQSQEHVRTYTRVEVRDDGLVVDTVRAEASAAGPVGSSVDRVTIHR